MVNRRRPKRDSSLYDDPSENIRVAENNRLYDSFTREDVAVHRKINQYTIDNTEPPEVKRQVLESFVCMPRKIITRSMLSFIYSTPDPGLNSKSSDSRPSPTPTVLTPPFIQNPEPEPMDPRSSGEAMDMKSDFSVQESANSSSMDLRQASSCSIHSPVASYDQYPEPTPIDPRSSGEALMLRSMTQNGQTPDRWNMSSISQVLNGFEVSSSISTKSRSCQAFGRSTFTMTGNSNLYKVHRSKFAEPAQAALVKPPPFLPNTESPPAFRPPTTENVSPFLQSVQPSPPIIIKPPSDNVDAMNSVTSLLSGSSMRQIPETHNETFSKLKLFEGAKPDEGLTHHLVSNPPFDQGSTESSYAGMFWNLITRCWKYFDNSFRTMWESLSG